MLLHGDHRRIQYGEIRPTADPINRIFGVFLAEVVVGTQGRSKMAATGKPMIISTGMATLDEIDEAVATVRSVAPPVPIALLRTNSGYPASFNSIVLPVFG